MRSRRFPDCLSRAAVALSLTALALAPVACGASRNSFARYPGAATAFNRTGQDAKALAIADQVLAAAGGKANWNKAHEIQWTEAIIHNGQTMFSGDQAWDRWNGRHYGRLHTPSGDVVVMRELYSGKGSAYFQHSHQFTRMPVAESKKALAEASDRWQFDTAALCMPFLLEAPGTTLTYVGPAKDEAGQETLDDLKVVFDSKDTTRDGTYYHVVVNRTNHQIERVELVKPGKTDTQRIGYKLSGWVEVGGLKFPTAEQNIGFKGEALAFKDIKVSSEPDDDLYVPHVR